MDSVPPRLPGANAVQTVHVGGMDLSYGRLDVNATIASVQDVTPLASATKIRVAELEHAIPAQERTKQAQEETKRALSGNRHVSGRHVLWGLVVLALAGIICAAPKDVGVAIASGAALVASVVLGVPKIIEAAKKKVGSAE
jgi:hypothetical protein